MVTQPLLDQQAELSQFPLVGAKHRKVIHVSGVMLAELALPDENIQRLQHCVGKPL